jgi:hypothetical protein
LFTPNRIIFDKHNKMNYVLLGIIIGFFFMFVINYIPKKTNQKLILHFNQFCFHIHHWIIGILLLVLAFLVKYSNETVFNIIIGLLAGFVLEGFLFKDMFNILVKC